MKTHTIASMLETISGLCGTRDLNAWEERFVKSCLEAYGQRKVTSHLSGKQAECIAKIFDKHFA